MRIASPRNAPSLWGRLPFIPPPHAAMSACPQQFDIEKMFCAKSGSGDQASALREVAKHSNSELWRVVSPDDSTGSPESRLAGGERRPLSSYFASDEEATIAPASAADAESEPGVDLSYLQADGEVVSKMIAGLKAAPEEGNRRGRSSGQKRAIAMPTTKTDLGGILKDDKVCSVGRSHAEERAAHAKQSGGHAPMTGCVRSAQDVALSRIVESWPKLPAKVQTAISAVVDAAVGRVNG